VVDVIERIARRVIVALVLVTILPTAVAVIGRIFAQALSVHTPGELGLVGCFLLALFTVLFAAGLAVRIGRGRHDQDAAAARLERTAVRAPSPDVPLDRQPTVPEDTDPTLPLGGE
jgi:hypothetical protein